MSLDLETDIYQSAGTELIMDAIYGMQDMYIREREYARSHKLPKVTQQSISNRLKLKGRSIVNRWLNGKENMTLRSIGELARALNHKAVLTFEHLPATRANGEGIVHEEAPIMWVTGGAMTPGVYQTPRVAQKA